MKNLTAAIEIAEDLLTELVRRQPTSPAEEITLEGNIKDARDAVRSLRNLKNSTSFSA